MKRAYIFANGNLPALPASLTFTPSPERYGREPVDEWTTNRRSAGQRHRRKPQRCTGFKDGLIIAADNGAAHCKRLNITPHIIIGDMDSVAPGLLAEYEQQGVTIIRYPVDKNETDLELALAQARSQGTSEIMVFGIIGDRWDMTIANALALAHPSLQDISIRAINGDEELIVIRSGRVVAIHGAPGEMVSLIPLCVPAAGITLDGLRYQLNNANLSFGAGRGLSNELLTHEGKIEIKQGILLCIITHHSQPIT